MASGTLGFLSEDRCRNPVKRTEDDTGRLRLFLVAAGIIIFSFEIKWILHRLT